MVGLLEATWVNAELTELPEVVEATAWVICATAAAKVSDTDRPLVSVAVTLRLSEVAVAGAVPLNVSVVPLNFNQAGSAEPLACVAVKVNVSFCGSVKVLDAKVKLIAWLVPQLWAAVCAVTVGAAAGVETEKVSVAESPLVSVAVTEMVSPVVLLATVPVKVPVLLLNDSQDGNAAPFESVAL